MARAKFVTSVVEEYRHSFVAELYGALSIMKYIDSVLVRYPHSDTEFTMGIGSNCSSVLDTLWISSPVIIMSRYLY